MQCFGNNSEPSPSRQGQVVPHYWDPKNKNDIFIVDPKIDWKPLVVMGGQNRCDVAVCFLRVACSQLNPTQRITENFVILRNSHREGQKRGEVKPELTLTLNDVELFFF